MLLSRLILSDIVAVSLRPLNHYLRKFPRDPNFTYFAFAQLVPEVYIIL